ncbi:hypothetical protein BDN72DRAFT_884185 [Pluteus cervinus]|uniref:Uncharacterized protein n=1 Tax=Pluteus cervinus TaxID=181527 RepID=A0ACD2ZYS4_9AGAR|nr:hypothetical protein BDN72DRAFT_884185 [Pluteus cervinus]
MASIYGSFLYALFPRFYNTINYYYGSPHGIPQNPANQQHVLENLAKVAIVHANKAAGQPKCHAETRQATRKMLTAWLSDQTAGSVRWVNGWPGTGKTAIAQTMAECWKEQGYLVACFFFSTANERTTTTQWFNQTLAYQLLQSQSFPDNVLHLLLNEQLSQSGWAGIVEALITLPPNRPVVIIIDGLDACRDQIEQIELLRDVLRSARDRRLPQCVRFLICCRPERHLEKVFDDFDPSSSYRTLLGDTAQDNNDVRTFLRLSLKTNDSQWPSDREIDQLVNRAKGQFIYATTVVAFVDPSHEGSVERLELVLSDYSPSFAPIDELYLAILEKVEAESPKDSQLIHHILLHVFYIPSSPSGIAQFWFEKDADKINTLVGRLRAVMDHSGGLESSILYRHKSFPDFLERPHSPHRFSLAKMDPVSRLFFLLRTSITTLEGLHVLFGKMPLSQWLSYLVYRLHDSQLRAAEPFVEFSHFFTTGLALRSYEERARKLHEFYVPLGPDFRGCICCLGLEKILLSPSPITTLVPCGETQCVLVLSPELRELCQRVRSAAGSSNSPQILVRYWKESNWSFWDVW